MRMILTVIMLFFAFSGAYSEDWSKILERHALAATPKDEKTLESLARYLSQGRPQAIFDKRVNFWTTNSAGDEATAREIFVWVARLASAETLRLGGEDRAGLSSWRVPRLCRSLQRFGA